MKTLKHYASHLSILSKPPPTNPQSDLHPDASLKPPLDSLDAYHPTLAPDVKTKRTLKQYASYLSLRRPVRKASTHSLGSSSTLDSATLAPPTISRAASTASTSATSSLAGPRSEEPTPKPEALGFAPPHSESEYRWNLLHTNIDGEAKGKSVWWRNVDAMANFILHWQTRFFQHGDMFGTCTLSLSFPSPSHEPASERLQLTTQQLREAIRRLRYNHPTVALRLAKRAELGIAPLAIPPFLQEKVDLQVALVYDVVTCEAELEAWLDDVLVLHPEERREEADEFAVFLQGATADGVPGRDRLRIHFWPASDTVDARILVEQCHSVSEGIGTLIVFDLLLASIAGVLSDDTPLRAQWGSEVVRLEPALQDAIASPPTSWNVSAAELKEVQRVNADRMNGKATAPNLADKVGAHVVRSTLDGHCSGNKLRRDVLNRPLVGLCRSVAEKGDMLPLGLLPQSGRPFTGSRTHTAFITDTLDPTETKTLLSTLKQKGLTLAPFLEACSHMATMWTRKQRRLVPASTHRRANRGYDDPARILGSFSNAISKRDTLQPEYARYLGLCMSGFPTKVAAAHAVWSPASEDGAASPTDPRDLLPAVQDEDVGTLFRLAHELAAQYSAGRDNRDWLRHDKALMFSTMHTEYLFLRDAAHYPSIPWLSSLGRLENVFAGSHAIRTTTPSSLEAHNMRLLGRVGIRQPILHVYTFRMHTTVQFSFADWLYNPPGCDGRKVHGEPAKHNRNVDQEAAERQNILHFWLQVYRALVDAVLDDAVAVE